MRRWITGLGIALVLAGCEQPDPAPEPAPQIPPAALVLFNGRITTVDPELPEAESLAVRPDGRIAAVGPYALVSAYVGPSTKVIDLQGRRAIPGFVEGHGHFLGAGQRRLMLDLRTVQNWDEVVAMVAKAAAAAPPGSWIRGRGWHQEKWDRVPEPAAEGMPVHAALSAVSPEHPVLLTHASGHASFANAKALELASITRDTQDPRGGKIVRDAQGEPSGVLRETAAGLVSRAYGAWRKSLGAEALEAEFQRMVQLAGEEALSKGITSFHDAGASFATIDRFRKLAENGRLPVRLYVMVGGESNAALARRLPDYRIDGGFDGFLTVRAVKRYIDGALGSHGAWLLEPYADKPDSTGHAVTTPAHIEEAAVICAKAGFQICTHAIGDRANREVLDAYERALTAQGQDGPAVRWRIEHAQHIHPGDVPRFAGLGVIAAMQGVHCTSDGPWVPKRLGAERARANAYVWRSLLDAGAVVANGTDAPVEDMDPIACFYATVTRRMANGDAFFPEQRLTRAEALYSYTLANAYAAFEEAGKGSLEPGKVADIVVLSHDIMTCAEDEIRSAHVDLTIVGGIVRYRRAR